MQVNRYFDDQVLSLSFENAAGTQSVGLMAVGEYTFGTSQDETMTVVSGTLSLKREGDSDFAAFQAGKTFEITANLEFNDKTAEPTAYTRHQS